ncbi:MAG: hypothetical protein EOP06_19180 [Proteobacteria bacterium]|nr:MAG: hypothetical protein EOP06_19180 [Pseudomonadota bacterium]
MQTISLHGKVSEDGILRLEVPVGARGEEVEVVVVIQPNPHRLLSLGQLAGSIDDETFVEPKELSLNSACINSNESIDWVNETYGVCANDPIERPNQNN